MTDGARATAISERRWAVVDRAGIAALARRQPLTVEGEDIGSFDLMLACGAGGDSYDVSYVERRHDGDRIAGAGRAWRGDHDGRRACRRSLKVVSSERRAQPDELVTYAAGTVPAALIGAFAAAGNHSMLIETKSAGMVTGIRLGNTGAQQNLPRLPRPAASGAAPKARRRSRRLGVARERQSGGMSCRRSRFYSAAMRCLRFAWPRSDRAPTPPHRR